MEGERFDVSLVLTHACNLACSYCYMGEHHATAMPRSIAERAIEAAFAEAGRVHVGFFGGEPLLEWDLLTHVLQLASGIASERGAQLSFQLTSNGTLIDAARAEVLRERGVGVAISLDGDAGVHDRARANAGGGASFLRVIGGIGALRAAGVHFQLIAVVTPANVRELVASVRLLDSLGPTRILLNPAWEAAWSEEDLGAWQQQLELLAAMWEQRFGTAQPLALSLFEGKLAAAARGVRKGECGVGRWNVAVAPSGHLYPCDRMVADDRHDNPWRIGHLDQGLGARGRIPRGHGDPICEPCVERFRCGASCACANIAETGVSNRAGGVQCWYEQTVAELADLAGFRLIARGCDDFVKAAYGDLRSSADAAARVAIKRRLQVLP